MVFAFYVQGVHAADLDKSIALHMASLHFSRAKKVGQMTGRNKLDDWAESAS